MPSADYAMSEAAEKKKRRKRKYHVPAEFAGIDLVMAELLRRGFDAELAGASCEKHDMLVWVRGSRPKPVQIKTVYSPP
jgi:SOS response regulatory protein OraA/RecX